MSNENVLVITPTSKRNLKIIERCIQSVKYQTYRNPIHHIICSDGDKEEHIEKFLKNTSCIYCNIKTPANTYGASVRQFVLDHLNYFSLNPTYILHLDDDNLIFPHYIETMVSALKKAQTDFAICKILHLGPLPHHLGTPPQIISGIPPIKQNIDTLQVLVKKDAILQCQWETKSGPLGYFNDGVTFERLGKMFSWIEVPELLGIHL